MITEPIARCLSFDEKVRYGVPLDVEAVFAEMERRSSEEADHWQKAVDKAYDNGREDAIREIKERISDFE